MILAVPRFFLRLGICGHCPRFTVNDPQHYPPIASADDHQILYHSGTNLRELEWPLLRERYTNQCCRRPGRQGLRAQSP